MIQLTVGELLPGCARSARDQERAGPRVKETQEARSWSRARSARDQAEAPLTINRIIQIPVIILPAFQAY